MAAQSDPQPSNPISRNHGFWRAAKNWLLIKVTSSYKTSAAGAVSHNLFSVSSSHLCLGSTGSTDRHASYLLEPAADCPCAGFVSILVLFLMGSQFYARLGLTWNGLVVRVIRCATDHSARSPPSPSPSRFLFLFVCFRRWWWQLAAYFDDLVRQIGGTLEGG